jgi:hypothetical protein
VCWKVQNVLNYINVPHYFRYASLNALGLHKGSGVTEGACKSLIAKHTARGGQRFRPRGISAVLAVLSLLDSDRLARASGKSSLNATSRNVVARGPSVTQTQLPKTLAQFKITLPTRARNVHSITCEIASLR